MIICAKHDIAEKDYSLEGTKIIFSDKNIIPCGQKFYFTKYCQHSINFLLLFISNRIFIIDKKNILNRDSNVVVIDDCLELGERN